MNGLQEIRVPGVVIHVANAFNPDRNRLVEPVSQACTIREWMASQGIEEFSQPTFCLFNGEALLRAEWGRTVIGSGDVCTFVALPHGGGGGGGGKNPLRIVMNIVVLVASIYTGGVVGAAYGATWGAVAGAAVSVVGGALVNALVPVPKPAAASFSGNDSGFGSASPTYSIQAQANSARLGQVIPSQYGRHKVFPDLIVNEPWSEYIDNEQYLNQPMSLGLGLYDVERIQIGETSIDNFEEVTYEIVEPGQAVSLFDVNVITRTEVASQELKGTNEQEGDGYVGPFVLNPVDTLAHKVGIDVACPRGLYYANDSGTLSSRSVSWVVECRQIDEDDQPVGSGDWVTLGSETLTDAKNSVIRKTYNYDLPSHDRYEVRLRRTNAKDLSDRAGNELVWGALKAFVEGPTSFDNVSLLLVRMRATNNLSQRSSRMVNVIQTRKIPIWDDGLQAWSEPEPCRAIAWALADICRSSAGAGLSDNRIMISDLVDLDADWSARGDQFDGVIDSKLTIWDALKTVCRCGRAVPVQQGGIVRFVRDAPKSIPVAMYGPRNIVKNSFEISYLMPNEDTADAVKVEFFNERTWKPDSVTCKLEDSEAVKPGTMKLLGSVVRAHSKREGDYEAAANRYRRIFVNFRTELDGMIPTYGDLIMVTHDMPRWGQGGEVIEWVEESGLLRLSEPLEWQDGVSHFIGLRGRNGILTGPYLCEPGDQPDLVRVLEPLEIDPYTGTEEERTYFSFGPDGNWGKLCRFLSCVPRNGGEQLEITAVVEDSRVHVN